MANPVGRPLKYKDFIAILEDEVIYSPATIVNNGEAFGLLDRDLSEADLKQVRTRIRHTLARFSTNHGFPQTGDGWVILKGQPPIRGWKGKLWKRGLPQGN